MNERNTAVFIQLYGTMQPPNAEPLSVEVLASALMDCVPNVAVKIFGFSYLDGEIKLDALIKDLETCRPFLVGVSIPQSTYDLSLKLLDRLTGLLPTPFIVIGHALPSYSPEVFLRLYHQLVVIRGWGEDGIVQLAKKILQDEPFELAEIPNLVFFHEGEIKYTEIKFQTTLYQPARILSEDYYIRIESSRGCSYNVCTFCTRPVGMQNSSLSWIKRDNNEVISELCFLIEKGISRFTFTDEDFVGNNLDAAMDLAYRLREFNGLKFSLSVRADSIYDAQKSFAENQEAKKLFEILRDAGLELIFVGAESFSRSQLRRYGKGIDPDDNLRALSVLQSLGINYEIGFMLFDPLMSMTELQENILCLERSGIWARTGYLFNVLRPQIASPYVKMLAASELLGKFDVDTLSFDYKFLEPKIEQLVKFCCHWSGEIELIYLLSRNLERTTDSNVAYTKFMFDARSLLFRLLKSVYSLIEKEDFLVPSHSFLMDYYRERDGIIEALTHHIRRSKNKNTTEEALLFHCQNYISSKKHTW